jgi:hypothetical protein
VACIDQDRHRGRRGDRSLRRGEQLSGAQYQQCRCQIAELEQQHRHQRPTAPTPGVSQRALSAAIALPSLIPSLIPSPTAVVIQQHIRGYDAAIVVPLR